MQSRLFATKSLAVLHRRLPPASFFVAPLKVYLGAVFLDIQWLSEWYAPTPGTAFVVFK